MVESNDEAKPIDEIKVRSVVALCDELHALSPDDPQYAAVLRRLDDYWRTLSPAEQDEIDRIFGRRGLVRLK
jgi:hypothetical protein